MWVFSTKRIYIQNTFFILGTLAHLSTGLLVYPYPRISFTGVSGGDGTGKKIFGWTRNIIKIGW
jgi:hypothetical protein